MNNLKLTTALAAVLAIAAPANATMDNTSAKSEAIIPQGDETNAGSSAEIVEEMNESARSDAAPNEAGDTDTLVNVNSEAAVGSDVEMDKAARDDANSNEIVDEVVETASDSNMTVTTTTTAELDNTSAKSEAIIPQGDETNAGSSAEVVEEMNESARGDAAPNEAGDVDTSVNIASEAAVGTDTEIDKAARDDANSNEIVDLQSDENVLVSVDMITTEDLEGTRVYDANNNWVGEISMATGDAAVIDVGGFLGIGEKPVLLEWSQLDILQEKDSEDFRVYTKLTEAELEALPTYNN